MRYLELPVLSAITAGLLLITVPSQLRTRNLPTFTLILSTCVLCAVNAANAFAWNGHVQDIAPAWCDFGELFARRNVSGY